MSKDPKSIEMIILIAHALGELNKKAIFVGGATVPFYLPKVYWANVRPTDDVDVVMKVIGRIDNWVHEEVECTPKLGQFI